MEIKTAYFCGMEGKNALFGKDLRKLIIPLIIEQILAIAVGMADTIMVLRREAGGFRGVSLVDTVNILLINVFSALATGGAVVSGHFLGKKKERTHVSRHGRSYCSPHCSRSLFPLFL